MPLPEVSVFMKDVRPLFWQRRLWTFVSLIAGLVFLVTAVAESLWQILFLILTVACLSKLGLIQLRLETRVWRVFERQLTQLSASPAMHLRNDSSIDSVLSRFGDSYSVEPITYGLYNDYPVRLSYVKIEVLNKRKDRVNYNKRYRVLEIVTRQQFYPVFIDSKRNDSFFTSNAMHTLSRSLRNNSRLSVEGDVNRHFDIYVPRLAKFRSLITLAPDTLLALSEYGKAFDIEFNGSIIYLITADTLRSARDVYIYQTAVFKLLDSLGKDLARHHDDTSEFGKIEVDAPKIAWNSTDITS